MALPPQFAALLPASASTGAAPAPGALPPAFASLLPQTGAGGAAAPAGGATPGQQARALWARTSALGKPLTFVGQGLNDVGTGIDHLLGISTRGPLPQAHFPGAPAQPNSAPVSPQVMGALDAQHPLYNYGVKWPMEFAASAPLAEGAGELAGAATKALPLGSGVGARVIPALARSSAMGAAYGVQQPQGSPGVNAAVGAVAGPIFEGATNLAGRGLRFVGEGIDALRAKLSPRMLEQPEIDSILARRFADQGLPTSVALRDTVPGVHLTPAVHSGDPKLMGIQSAERLGDARQDFNELHAANNGAIVNGLRQHFAPQPDSSTVSSTAHDLLLGAQKRAKAAVRSAYGAFDAAKGGIYLQREPIQNALREAYEGLLPAHQEMLPAKLREVMEADHPLHLSTDLEDLSARLNDAYRTAVPGTTAARAATVMRDALQKGIDASSVATDAERPGLIYDPARAPLPKRNMVESDPSQDSILQWLAKHPKGISSAEAEAQGLDPADMRGSAARVGIRRAFRQGGMSFDQAAEALHQAGYPVADERGNYDPNALLNAIDGELRGHPVYSMENTRQAAELAQDAALRPSAATAGEAPDLTDLAARAMHASPERAQAALDAWTDDQPATIARVQRQLQAAIDHPQQVAANDAEQAWKAAKAANAKFRERFPQGTARDTEARQWLSRRLLGLKSPTKFFSEALTSPDRAQAVLDALRDNPAEREQMRGLMRNSYVNKLLGATREGAPGVQTLNATALMRARANNAAIERVLLNPAERDLLDRYVQAAGDNAKLLQRVHSGSSETAALRNYQQSKKASLGEEAIKHVASVVHPAIGALVHVLPGLVDNSANNVALEDTLRAALIDPGVYNRVAGAAPADLRGPAMKLFARYAAPAKIAATRPAMFAVPRALGPPLAGAP
jgi:hypothetical protein